jgi:hypothetical protein
LPDKKETQPQAEFIFGMYLWDIDNFESARQFPERVAEAVRKMVTKDPC